MSQYSSDSTKKKQRIISTIIIFWLKIVISFAQAVCTNRETQKLRPQFHSTELRVVEHKKMSRPLVICYYICLGPLCWPSNDCVFFVCRSVTAAAALCNCNIRHISPIAYMRNGKPLVRDIWRIQRTTWYATKTH